MLVFARCRNGFCTQAMFWQDFVMRFVILLQKSFTEPCKNLKPFRDLQKQKKPFSILLTPKYSLQRQSKTSEAWHTPRRSELTRLATCQSGWSSPGWLARHMYIYVYVYTYKYIYMFMYMYIYMYMFDCEYVRVLEYSGARVLTYLLTYSRTSVHTYARTHVLTYFLTCSLTD